MESVTQSQKRILNFIVPFLTWRNFINQGQYLRAVLSQLNQEFVFLARYFLTLHRKKVHDYDLVPQLV